MNRPDIDVLLVTALKEEFVAARAVAETRQAEHPGVAQWEEKCQGLPYPYLVGLYRLGHGTSFRIALTRPTRMGGIPTGQVAAALIERLHPRCVVMSGVCAGNPAKVTLGDVVISSTAYSYDEGKKKANKFIADQYMLPISEKWSMAASNLAPDGLPSHRATMLRAEADLWLLERLLENTDPRSHPARERYFRPAQWPMAIRRLEQRGHVQRPKDSLRLTRDGRAHIERALYDNTKSPRRLPFKIHVGPTASGAVVVKDGITWDQLAEQGVASVVALEMEAAAIARAAHQGEVAQWCVVKGVMDYADPRKDDRYKPFAARASAEVLFKLLAATTATLDAATDVRLTAVRAPLPLTLLKNWQLSPRDREASVNLVLAALERDPAERICKVTADLLADEEWKVAYPDQYLRFKAGLLIFERALSALLSDKLRYPIQPTAADRSNGVLELRGLAWPDAAPLDRERWFTWDPASPEDALPVNFTAEEGAIIRSGSYMDDSFSQNPRKEGLPASSPIFLQQISPWHVWARVAPAVVHAGIARGHFADDISGWVISDRSPAQLASARPIGTY